MKKNFFILLFSALVTLLVSCGATEGIVIYNDTGFTIDEISVGASTADSWEFLDVLNGELSYGSSITVGADFLTQGPEALYDFRMRDEDGDYYFLWELEYGSWNAVDLDDLD